MPEKKEKQEELFKGGEELNLNTEFVVFDKPGEYVEGVYDGVEVIDGQYGEQNYWRIEDSSDTLKLIVETVMLARARRKLRQGEKVAVMYDGDTESKKGNTIKQYRVFKLPDK